MTQIESEDGNKNLMFAVDQISTFVGKGAGWLIIVLMVIVCIDVFRRYVLNAPSAWIGEHTTQIANGPPVYQFKSLIPVAGGLLILQGFVEILRYIICLKTGDWPARLNDAQEIDVVEQQLQASTYVDEEAKNLAIARAKSIDEEAHHRLGGAKGANHG